ncbi:PP2C family protein-serine/threonine phosphatase [Thermomonospora echinospora]|uniref:PP2C family protein-serine/threonine phosphatase n=1 Tax=Thermomonospora echinospora TaxID=1992 RepID=UPI001F389941|nr:PP2C family protein-serine/threonine phosphatase [Thermomonospora echinospora]
MNGSQDVLDPVARPVPYAALSVDASGVIVRLNDAARVLFGAAPGVLLGGVAPGWLVAAHESLAGHCPDGEAGSCPVGGAALDGAFRGSIGERVFEARPMLEGEESAGPVSTTWWVIDITEQDRLMRELEVERERTALLAEASSRLMASLNLERCMEVTVRLAARHLADAAVVIAPRNGRVHPVAYCGPDGQVDHRELRIDLTEVPGLAEAMQGFLPVPSRWIDPSAAPEWIARGQMREPGAMVVTALPGHGTAAGALVLLRRARQEAFSGDEEVFARLFAARAGAAMSAARMYAEQAAITRTLMSELLPPRTNELDGVELSARYRPAGDGELVGGDFYDLYPADAADPDGESLVVLGDVCGKGLEAAVLTGKIRNTLRALLPMAGDHQHVLELLNQTMLYADTTRFVTLVLASIRRRGTGVRLKLTSAGHAAPLIVRTDGKVEMAGTKGSLIGVLDDIVSTTATVALEPGDTCLLYTDGITEAIGGPLGSEMFGDERLRVELGQCGGMPPEALVERVHMLAAEWVGSSRHDDMATVAITAPRRSRLSAVDGHGPDGTPHRDSGRFLA